MESTELRKPVQAPNYDRFVKETSSKSVSKSKGDATKVNTADNDNYQSIMHKGRKRALKTIIEKNETVQENDGSKEEDIATKKQRKSEKRPIPSIRFDFSLGHLPSIDKSRKVRCKYEGCPNSNFKSYVLCSTCDVHLCFCIEANRNCFAEYHKIKK